VTRTVRAATPGAPFFPRAAGTTVLAALFLGASAASAAAPVAIPVTTAATVLPSSVADQVLTLVNAERRKAGCAPVRLDPRLTAAALGHSREMADRDFLSHTSPDGATFADRGKAQGYPQSRSENVAAGNTTAAATMRQWMDSPGHRENILDCSAKDMGLGAAARDGSTFGTYWTQDFGLG
jgi:uncharacterized protein YkwD